MNNNILSLLEKKKAEIRLIINDGMADQVLKRRYLARMDQISDRIVDLKENKITPDEVILELMSND